MLGLGLAINKLIKVIRDLAPAAYQKFIVKVDQTFETVDGKDFEVKG